MVLYKRKYVNLGWFVCSLLGGVVVGVLWWLISPGGLWGVSVMEYEYNAGRDSVFVLLNVFAGLCGFVCLLFRKDCSEFVKIFVAVVSASLGSLTAWVVGIFLGSYFVSVSSAPDLFKDFTLLARGGVVLWPFLVVFLYFVYSFFRFFFVSQDS